jgi:hypothetical protein
MMVVVVMMIFTTYFFQIFPPAPTKWSRPIRSSSGRILCYTHACCMTHSLHLSFNHHKTTSRRPQITTLPSFLCYYIPNPALASTFEVS